MITSQSYYNRFTIILESLYYALKIFFLRIETLKSTKFFLSIRDRGKFVEHRKQT
jgi:hypothetical protein